jgi:hypothetical protein
MWEEAVKEIEFTENYVRSLIDSYENYLQMTITKKTEAKMLNSQIETCHSVLNYLQARKDILTGAGKMYK